MIDRKPIHNRRRARQPGLTAGPRGIPRGLRRAARRLVIALVPALGLATSLATAADDEATAVIERLHRALVDVAATEPAPTLEQRYTRLEPVVLATHDLHRMGRFSAGRHWRAWTESERAAFIDAFTRLSIASYASRFASIGPENFEILGSEAIGDQFEVNARIHRPEGDPVALDYVLERSDDAWRIVMISTDGVSELSMKRAEYGGILAEGGIDDLLAAIQSQIDALD